MTYPTYEDEEREAYRESPDTEDIYGRPVVCRFCKKTVYEDFTIDGLLCVVCAKQLGMSACSNCGKATRDDEMTERKEIGEHGRIMRYDYCRECVSGESL